MAATTNAELQAIARVERAADRYADARAELDDALVAARAVGLPLRDLAEASGLSKEWVRRIAAKGAAS